MAAGTPAEPGQGPQQDPPSGAQQHPGQARRHGAGQAPAYRPGPVPQPEWPQAPLPTPGRVYVAGAGPGDPGRLTPGTARCLQQAQQRPLCGRRVLVTRRRDQSAGLVERLEAAGADVDLLPLIEVRPPEDCGPLDAAIARLGDFRWVIFTSANAVDYFCRRLSGSSGDARSLAAASLAAIGESTAAELQRHGLRAELVPEQASQEGLVTALAGVPVEGCQILIPGSSLARTHLDEALETRGAHVARVTAYANLPPDPASVVIPARLLEGVPDVAVFASPSAVRHLAAVLGEARAGEVLGGTAVAVLGPTTAQAVVEAGYRVTIQPASSSIPALVEAICQHFAGAP